MEGQTRTMLVSMVAEWGPSGTVSWFTAFSPHPCILVTSTSNSYPLDFKLNFSPFTPHMRTISPSPPSQTSFLCYFPLLAFHTESWPFKISHLFWLGIPSTLHKCLTWHISTIKIYFRTCLIKTDKNVYMVGHFSLACYTWVERSSFTE